MVIISPTTASGLDSSYTVRLPNFDISLEAPKAICTARTISGAGVVSVWAGSIIGEDRSTSLTVTRAQYLALKAIKNSSADVWLVRMRGRIFTAVFDMPSARPNKEVSGFYDVTIQLIFTGENT